MGREEDQPVTPAGRFFLQPEMQQVINCIFGFKDPIDVVAFKAEVRRTLLEYHPRFSCVLVRDDHGVEHWRRTPAVDLDIHVIVIPDEEEEEGGEGGDFVSDYVAGLTVSAPLDPGKPLWEAHLLLEHRCCVLRLHHALGDGVSLMSLFLACCERADGPGLPVTLPPGGGGGRGKGGKSTSAVRRPRRLAATAWRLVLVAWYTALYVVDFLLHSLWAKDGKTPITGGAGVELWPRKLVTVTFSLADMKAVKRTVDGTINDVLFGIISYGLAKYLESRSFKKSSKDLRITGLAMVNTRSQPGLQELSILMKNKKSRWGNQFGYVLLPLYLGRDVRDPLQYVRRAKAMVDRKKLSLEAHFSYSGGALIMSLLGPKVATLINYRIVSNTSFTLSNVVGPLEEIMFAKNPVTYLRVTSTALPHAITIHMVTYMGKADMQILVAKDIIHDPELLAKCFKDALSEMKTMADKKN